jgi:hypothetical protein
MSFSFFVAGAVLATICYMNKELSARYLHIIFGFYAVMELLQTFQYYIVNKCDSPINILSTEFAYLLVIVQPLLWNTVFYLRSTNAGDKKLFILAITLCILWIIMNVYARLAYDKSKETGYNCGIFNHIKTCTRRDDDKSHLYWTWTTAHLRDFTANFFMYLALWFIPALLVNHTRMSGYFLIIGAIIGFMLTYLNGIPLVQFPSIWCYISVPILIAGYLQILLKTKLL